MDQTRLFFGTILPPDGLKCITHILPGQKPRQYFYEDLDKLATCALACDRAGGSVYHGCAQYARHGRQKSDVESVKAFWLDIDLFPKASYRDAQSAAQSVWDFCSRLGIRTLLVVASGNGLHCYWPLASPVDRPTWERYALGLKSACNELGLEAGRERTADCASILRPPGTYWRKDGPPRLVEMGDIPEPFELGELDVFLSYNGRLAETPKPVARAPTAARSGLFAKVQTKSLEVVDFEALADACGQIGLLRETRGNLSEPIWHAGMVLLAHCAEGERQGHVWSTGHPTYSFGETQSYLERGRERSGPTTCAHFKSINPETCKGCSFSVSTPLSIPTGQQKVVLPLEVEAPTEDWKKRELEGFAYHEGGLCTAQEDKAGEKQFETICADYVYLDAVQRGELRRTQHFYRFRHFLPHSGWHTVEMPAGQARGQHVVSVFADQGLNVRDGEAFRRFIALSVDAYHKERDMETQYEQYGWKDGGTFLYGERLYTAEKTIEVSANATMRARNQWLKPKEGGSLAAWRDAINRLFGAGSEGQSFAIISAFASPLMPFCSDEGGAIVSLVTRDSGGGKTTSITGAYTVYASDKRALGASLIDTANSMPEALALLCNLPVFHDEFKGDPEIIDRKVREYTEGRSKQRLGRDGQLQTHVGNWSNILITASNQSLVDTVGGLNGSDAMAYRILEFPVLSAGQISHVEADRLRKLLEANAGWAGDIYLEYITRPDVLEWIKANLPVYQEEIVSYGKFGKAERFWTRTLACVAIAAQIMEHLELVAFSPDRVMKWAVDYFKNLKKPNARAAQDFLALYLNQHAAETLVVASAFNPKKRFGVVSERMPNKLTIRREEDTETYYIDFDSIRRWLIRHEVSVFEFNRELEKIGISRGFKQRTLGAGTNLGGGSIKVLDIDGGHQAFTGVIREVKTEKRSLG